MGTLGSLNTFDEYFLPFQTDPNRGSDSFYTHRPENENLGSYNFVATNVFKLFNTLGAKGIPNGQSIAYIYRFYAGGSIRDHFFKIGSNAPTGYRREGIIGVAYTQSGSYREAVYRFYRGAPYYDHLYSTSSSPPSGYVREGIAWWSPVAVYGCGDSDATNYNQYVNQTNTGCNYTIFGCTDSRASNYNPNANANDGSCTYPQANVSMSLSPSTIIQGQSATLSWSISNSTSRSLSGVGNIASNGSLTVTPSSTTTYTITASYYSYNSDSESERLTVYEKPDISVSINPTSINVGQSATLSWSTSGDASSMNIQPAPGSTNLNGSLTIEPTVSTTYTLTASGNGGTDTKQVTINVNQPASVSIDGPFSVSYGDTIDIQHSQELSTVRYELQVAITDLDGVITQDTIDLGASSSTPQTTYTYAPTYTNRGPSSIRFTLYGQGAGGLADSDQITVPINIDQLPDVINFPVSKDKLIDQQPVITPDVEISSEQVVVNDIDIPVEIKSDYPIQVQIDDGDFQNIRQI